MNDYPCSQADEAMYAADRANAQRYAARQAATKIIARYAYLDREYGTAVLTADKRVLFFDEQATCQQLTAADMPRLLLLGEVGTVAVAELLDRLVGGSAAIACSRKMER